MIKANDIAFLKTTGEAVFVLQVCEDRHCVLVRRPVAGQDGIAHVKDEFFKEELETLEEQRKRFMAEREEVLKKYGPTPNEAITTPDPGFGIN